MVAIPSSLIDKYKSFADDFISINFGVDCKLIYPPKQIVCTDCVQDSIGLKNANRYRHGGPAPTTFPGCSSCAGSGYKEEEVSEVIKMRVNGDPASWIGPKDIKAPTGRLQLIGFIVEGLCG